jgi:hypothetical protein
MGRKRTMMIEGVEDAALALVEYVIGIFWGTSR